MTKKGREQMEAVDSLILLHQQDAAFKIELLSCTVFEHMASAAAAFSPGRIFSYGPCAEKHPGVTALEADNLQSLTAAFLQCAASSSVLLLLQPAPAVSPQTLGMLARTADSAGGSAVLCAGDVPLALLAPRDKLRLFDFGDFEELSAMRLCQGLNAVAHYAPEGEKHIVADALSAFHAQEALRMRINLFWMDRGVFLMDPNTTYISPLASIGEGTTILPGCYLFGRTQTGERCRIGPNAYLQDAVLGDRVSVNSSQVFESAIGAQTTVGPFAYVRPGCTVGEKARIGDFVELKKADIGNGTKVAHLTYLGDIALGERVNVGCGVVAVNYDGKNKYRSEVGDDSFIGCNVNLVAPVKVGRGAYLAAATTVTEKDDVAEDSLVIGRVRAAVKPGWARKRRQDGKL